uniref:Chemokine interleukin-8-like domain-containing protein n=1 Tax=Haplochromis burtoni TaxID=8153 RepID=A0A3Q2WAW2_HAPBU
MVQLSTVCITVFTECIYVCTYATSQGVFEMSPGQCCFKFFTGRIPPKKIKIVSVFKSHSACLEKAFVIGTATGRRICVSQSVTWAQEAFASMFMIKHNKALCYVNPC